MTVMSAIPDDVMIAATKTFEATISYTARRLAINEIARAILAERDRAYRIERVHSSPEVAERQAEALGPEDRGVTGRRDGHSSAHDALPASKEAEAVGTCPSCGGNGVNPEGLLRPDGLLAECEICHGRGTVPIAHPPTEVSEAMVSAALDEAGSAWGTHLNRFGKEKLMRAALEAALSIPAGDGVPTLRAEICPRCSGTGRDPQTTSLQCWKCRGAGALSTASTAGKG